MMEEIKEPNIQEQTKVPFINYNIIPSDVQNKFKENLYSFGVGAVFIITGFIIYQTVK